VSTVFNNLDKDEIVEEIYAAFLDQHKSMDSIDCIDEKLLEIITKQYYIEDKHAVLTSSFLSEILFIFLRNYKTFREFSQCLLLH
jgi:hypothetical protein